MTKQSNHSILSPIKSGTGHEASKQVYQEYISPHLHSPALSSYAARPSLDITVHVSVACVVPLLGICTQLERNRE